MSVLLWWKPATAWWAGQVWKATLRYCLHFSGDRSESDSRSVRLSVTHVILQAKILEWVAFPFSRGSSQPRDWTQVSHTAGGFFTSWATREAKNTGVVSQSLLQRIFPTPESKWDLLHCRQILYHTTLQILQFLLLKYYQMSLIFFLILFLCVYVCVSYSVMSESLQPHEQYSPPDSSVHGDFPGQNTGVDCHSLLQGIFPTEGANPCLLLCRQILHHLSLQGSPYTIFI